MKKSLQVIFLMSLNLGIAGFDFTQDIVFGKVYKLYQPSNSSHIMSEMQEIEELTPVAFLQLCFVQFQSSYHEIIDATIESLMYPERQKDILYVAYIKILGKNMLLIFKKSGTYVFFVWRSDELTFRQKIKKSWWLLVGGLVLSYVAKLHIFNKIPAVQPNQFGLPAGFSGRPPLPVSLK